MDAPLTPDEVERYARHLVLPEIGGAGQQKLKAATILVIGAGGLGAPALQYLAAAGAGHIRVADDDIVSLSNLQRQVIHATQEIGNPKVESAKRAIARINPHVDVTAVNARFGEDNGARLLEGVTLAIDGSDNFDTRYLAAALCENAHVPLVTAAVGRFDGSITTLKPYETGSGGRPNPRYTDLFPSPPPPGAVPSCAEAGIVGALTGMLGTMQAMEAIKEITGAGDGLTGTLLMVDALAMRFQRISYARQESAP